MIPGIRQEMMPQGHEAASQAKFKRYMTIMDSMTDAELDSPKGIVETTRMKRLAIGSGRRMEDVSAQLLTEFAMNGLQTYIYSTSLLLRADSGTDHGVHATQQSVEQNG